MTVTIRFGWSLKVSTAISSIPKVLKHLVSMDFLDKEEKTNLLLIGLSCTLPLEGQQELVRCVSGLEECEIASPGYGVEYDYVDPR